MDGNSLVEFSLALLEESVLKPDLNEDCMYYKIRLRQLLKEYYSRKASKDLHLHYFNKILL